MKSSDDEEPTATLSAVDPSVSSSDGIYEPAVKKTMRQRIRSIVWDTLDRSPEERRFIAKIDFFILTWAGLTYFSKNLNTNNVCTSSTLPTLIKGNINGLSISICI